MINDYVIFRIVSTRSKWCSMENITRINDIHE